MIPLRDVIPSRTTPYITVTIIALNALAWLYELSLPHDALNEFLTVYGVGHGRFIVFYLMCGIVAALGQVAVDSNSMLPTIGASGAIAGVMGAYFVLYPHSRVLTLIPWIFIQVVELPAIALLGFWFLMQLFSAGTVAVTSASTGGGVAFAAHVVGFLTGVVGVFVFRKRELDPWDRGEYY
jgi:membrane associated rhomboid family serine protease